MKKILSILLSVAIVLTCIGAISFATSESTGAVKLISDAASTLEGQSSVPSEITITAGLTSQSWRLSLADDATNGKVVWWRGSTSYTYAGPQWAIADNLNSYLEANDAEKYTVTISAKVKYMTDDGSGSATDKCLDFGFRSSAGMNVWGKVIGYNAWVDASVTKELTKAEVQALTSSKLTFDGYNKAANSGTDKAVFFDSVQMTIETIEEGGEETPTENNLISAAASNFEGQSSIPSDISYVGTVASWRMGITTDDVQGKVLRYRRYHADTYSGPQWAYADALNVYLAANDAEKYIVTISAKVKYVTSDGSGTAEDGAMTFGFRSSSGMNSWGKVKGFNTWVEASFTKTLTKAELEALTSAKLTFDGYTKDAYSDATAEKAIFFDDIKMVVEIAPDEPVGLLPTSISTFGADGVTTHENMGFIGESNRFDAPSIVDGAFHIKKKTGSWVESYTSPAWYMAPYMKAYVSENAADSYVVNVSMDVKGNPGNATLAFRNSTAGNQYNMNYFDSASSVTADNYTTLTGTLTLTADQINSATEQGFALCLEGLAAGADIYIDNVALNMETKEIEQLGLLPNEISIFNGGNVTHSHLVYKETSGHIYSKTVTDTQELKVAYKAPADKNNTPMWLLGSYIKNFATENQANAYKVEVALDVKGAANSADLVIRRFKSDEDSKLELLKEAFTINGDTYTTANGEFYLTSAEALDAGETQFALAINNIILKDAAGGSWGTLNSVYFDNVVLKVTAVDKIPEQEVEIKEVANGDAEDGLKNWGSFAQFGGTVELSTDTKSGTGNSVKYSNPSTAYGSIAFDLGPAIIKDAAKGYQGNGYGTYKVKFDLKATKEVSLRPIINSQVHSDKTFANGNDTIKATTQWDSYEIEFVITEAMLEAVKAKYDAGGTEAYKLILRIDASDTMYKTTKTDAYWVDNVSISYVENSSDELDEEKELLSNANGVQFTLSKDLWDGWFVSKSGVVTEKDVKNGYATKSYTIFNTSKEPISLRMYIQSSMKLADGSTVWANAEKANSELITIEPGKSEIITVSMPVNDNNKVTIVYGNETKECELSSFFIRFNFEKGIFKDNSFIIKCDNSEVPAFMSITGVEKTAWTIVPIVLSGSNSNIESTGDTLQIALVSAVVVAVIGFVLIVKKTKEN